MESNGRYTDFINQQAAQAGNTQQAAQAGNTQQAAQAGNTQQAARASYSQGQQGVSNAAPGNGYTGSGAASGRGYIGATTSQNGYTGASQSGYHYQARYGKEGYNPNSGAQANQQNTYNARYGSYDSNAFRATYQQPQPTPQPAPQPPKKKRKGLKVLLVTSLIVLGVAGIGALAVWGTKSLKSNVNFTVNGKTIIGEKADNSKSGDSAFSDGNDGNTSKDASKGLLDDFISGITGKDSDDANNADTQNDASTNGAGSAAGNNASSGDNAAADGADSANSIKHATLGTGAAMTVVTDVTEVVKNTMPCLVSVNNAYVSKMNYFGQVYEQKGTSEGSGIIVGQNETELLLVSNNHVVQDAEELTITFVDEAQVPGYVKGTDADKDLAVVAVLLEDITPATKEAISIAQLGDSEALTVGEPVIAIGNSLGYGQSVTTGVVSALHRPIGLDVGQSQQNPMMQQAQPTGDVEIATFIQTDAAINPGNSGGALLNIYGQVIGINSNKIGGSAVEGMGYAIPISDAQPIIEDLMTMETRIKVPEEQRGILGITGVNVEKQYAVMYGMPEGVYISSLTEGAGAEAAGLTKGDIIVGLNEKGIESMDELKGELAYFKVGDKVTVTIMRSINGEYESQKIEVTLTKG